MISLWLEHTIHEVIKMILSKKKNGKGYVTSYTLNVGSKEARDLGFIDENGDSKQLEKIIDIENKVLIVKRKEEKP